MVSFERDMEEESCWHWLWFTINYLWAPPSEPIFPHQPWAQEIMSNPLTGLWWPTGISPLLFFPAACLNSLIPSQQEIPNTGLGQKGTRSDVTPAWWNNTLLCPVVMDFSSTLMTLPSPYHSRTRPREGLPD